MNAREGVSHVALMVPQLVQQWQADATVETPAVDPAVDPSLVPPQDAFDAAFDAITSTEPVPEVPAETVVVEPVVGDLPDPATVAAEQAAARAAEAAEAARIAAGGAPAAKVPDPAPAPAPKPGDTPAPTPSDALFNRLLEAIDKRPAPVVEAKKEPEPFKPTPYTQEQQQIIDDFAKEWPEVAAAQELMRSREYEALHNHIITQVRDVITQQQGQIVELQQVIGGMTGRSHVETLHAAVPDYSDVRDKVVTWVGEQPDYLKAAFTQVIQNGTVEQGIDLINRWRAATGTPAPTARVVPPAPAPAARVVAPKAPVKVPAGLAPVPTKRSVPVPAGGIPANFDDAFDMFAGQLTKSA